MIDYLTFAYIPKAAAVCLGWFTSSGPDAGSKPSLIEPKIAQLELRLNQQAEVIDEHMRVITQTGGLIETLKKTLKGILEYQDKVNYTGVLKVTQLEAQTKDILIQVHKLQNSPVVAELNPESVPVTTEVNIAKKAFKALQDIAQ
jgi:uncharacterized coiled-coil protein SlyX